MLDIEFLTDEPDVIILCQRYWQLDSDGTFAVRLRDLAPFRRQTNYGYVELLVLAKSIARDTRRRCPICGIPQRVGSRQSALLPITSQPPCSDCPYLKIKGTVRKDECRDVESMRAREAVKKSRFPASALVLLISLRRVIGVRLYEGFSIHDCAGLVPAHTVRFITMLYKGGILKKIPSSGQVGGAEPTKYILTDDLEFEEDFATFTSLRTTTRAFDFSTLQDLWLDYAVAECVRLLCGQCVLHDLPLDPANEELCAVLRMLLSRRSIAEVLAISTWAVQAVAVRAEHESTTAAFPVTIAQSIEQQHKLILEKELALQPITRPAARPSSELGVWFQKWYGIDEITSGHNIRGSMFAGIKTDS